MEERDGARQETFAHIQNVQGPAEGQMFPFTCMLINLLSGRETNMPYSIPCLQKAKKKTQNRLFAFFVLFLVRKKYKILRLGGMRSVLSCR